MVAEKVDVIDHFDADTERSQMGSIGLPNGCRISQCRSQRLPVIGDRWQTGRERDYSLRVFQLNKRLPNTLTSAPLLKDKAEQFHGL